MNSQNATSMSGNAAWPRMLLLTWWAAVLGSSKARDLGSTPMVRRRGQNSLSSPSLAHAKPMIAVKASPRSLA